MIKKLFNVPEKVYKHLHFKGVICVPVNEEKTGSFKLYSDGERIENEIFWGGITSWYEKVSMECWIKLCRNSAYIFDVGAYHGIYSLVAGAANQQSKIFAFEPVEDSYNKLLRNIQLNNFDVKTFKCGASGKDGKAEFYNIDAQSSLIGSLNKESFRHGETIVKRTIDVRSLKSIIDEFKLPSIDLIKMDVEGHEPSVIEGLAECLDIYKPAILLEVTTDDSAEKINKLVQHCGYLYFDIDEIHPPRQIPAIKKSSYFNVLICKPEIARKINLI